MFALKDQHLGIAGFIIFAILLYTLQGKSFQARAFPTALLIILMILCVVFIFRKGYREVYDFSSLPQVLLYGGLFLAYILILPHIGFILSTTAFLFGFLVLQKYPIKLYWTAAFSLASALVLWLLFVKGFGVRLPEILF